jgi:nicotinamide mononucleotide transporter
MKYIAAVLAGSLVWGWVLSKLGNTWFTGTFAPDPHPWLDAFMLMVTLLAQFLSAQKKWECWLVWLAVNVGNLVLYLTSGLVFMPIVSLLYLVNGIWSLYTWKKHYQNGK